MRAIHLCAGRGTRLGPVAADRPKCLLDVGDRPLLERQRRALDAAKVGESIVVIGAKGSCWTQDAYERIASICPHVVVNFDNDRSHNVLSMKIGLEACPPGDVLLIDGDLCFGPELTRLVQRTPSSFLVAIMAEQRDEAGTRIELGDGGSVRALGKSHVPERFPWPIHAGIVRVVATDRAAFLAACEAPQNLGGELEGAARTFIRERRLGVLSVDRDACININTEADLERAERIFSS